MNQMYKENATHNPMLWVCNVLLLFPFLSFSLFWNLISHFYQSSHFDVCTCECMRMCGGANVWSVEIAHKKNEDTKKNTRKILTMDKTKQMNWTNVWHSMALAYLHFCAGIIPTWHVIFIVAVWIYSLRISFASMEKLEFQIFLLMR